jgi:hypothetical protein
LAVQFCQAYQRGRGQDCRAGHLRGPGPHVRGCWAADLVLGKS